MIQPGGSRLLARCNLILVLVAAPGCSHRAVLADGAVADARVDGASDSAGWAIHFGGKDWDTQFGIALDSKDNILVTGSFSDTAVFGDTSFQAQGGADGYLAKISPAGSFVWVQTLSGPSDEEYGSAVVVDDSDQIFLAGNYAGQMTIGNKSMTAKGILDFFIAKANGSGSFLWSNTGGGVEPMTGPSGGYPDLANSIALDGAGNTYVVGGFNGTASFGKYLHTSNGYRKGYIAQLDKTGIFFGAHAFSGVGSSIGDIVALDAKGNIYFTGSYEGEIKLGKTVLNSQGKRQYFLARYDAHNAVHWVVPFDGYLSQMTIDPEGRVVVAGSFSSQLNLGTFTLKSAGDDDLFVAQIDSAGTVTWAQAAGGVDRDYPLSVTVDGASNIYLSGVFSKPAARFGTVTLTTQNSRDCFLSKLDKDGKLVWAVSAGDFEEKRLSSLALDSKGNLIISGMLTGNASFGPHLALASHGGYDVFVWKLMMLDGAPVKGSL